MLNSSFRKPLRDVPARISAAGFHNSTLWLILCGALLVLAFGVEATLPASFLGFDPGSVHAIAVVLSCFAGLAALTAAAVLFFRLKRLATIRSVEKKRLDIALDNITQGVMVYGSDARIVLCNRRYVEMYGLSQDIIRPGRHFRDVMEHRKDSGSFVGNPRAFCDETLRNVEIGKLTHRILRSADGRLIQIVNQPLADGGWVTTHEDVTELRQSQQRIEHLAHYDPLTNLPNRNLFREKLCDALRSLTTEKSFALLYMDVDQFKEINDSLGHPVGDEFLQMLAQRLQESTRPSDCVARLGGDEFAIIREFVTPHELIEFLDSLYLAIRQPIICGGHQLVPDASIGVATAPDHGTGSDELIRNADLAMYSAKSSGGRSYRFFERQMEARAKAHHQMASDLREAIAQNALQIHYQPVHDVNSGSITACEALVRWQHPFNGAISPSSFIPVAEASGLITRLGEWVLEEACKEAATWPSHIKVAVNVSPAQFRSKTFGLRVAKALADSSLLASRLELEITEAVVMQDDESASTILHQLRNIGVRIALDDFGIGYSSLSYLRRFPFDKIKIDRSFVADLSESGSCAAIVQAVVSIANAQSMETTAEGVETAEQLASLKALGCTQAQGWLFARAMPTSDLRKLLGVPGTAAEITSRSH